MSAPLPFRRLRTQETQETQDTQETQETQDTHRRPSLSKGKASCVSCVQEEGRGRSGDDLGAFLKRAATRSTLEVSKHEQSPRAEDFRSPALVFARCLKAHRVFTGLDAEDATAFLDAELEAMYPGCPHPWIAVGLPDTDSRGRRVDPRTDFLNVWDRIETPLEMGSLVHQAAEQADEKPLDLGERFRAPAEAVFVRLVSICYWLAQLAGGDFFLSCRDAGEVLGVSRETANCLIRRAEKLGYLEAVGEYSLKDRARGKAKTWRFIGDYALDTG